jgi:hypothetical protein
VPAISKGTPAAKELPPAWAKKTAGLSHVRNPFAIDGGLMNQ